MVFTASSATRTGERSFEIAGQLELLGKPQPLTLAGHLEQERTLAAGRLPSKPYVMGVSARGSFKRSGYGMNYARGQRLGRRRGAADHRVRGRAPVMRTALGACGSATCARLLQLRERPAKPRRPLIYDLSRSSSVPR